MNPVDDHALIAASRLLDVPTEYLERVVERYRETDGWKGPEFDLDYERAERLTGVAKTTLRARVHRGYYVEGADYIRKGPRTVRFSRRIVQQERERG
jgi:hypothetical protein